MTHRTLRVCTHTPEETRALGAAVGRLATPGTVFALNGELGAGKTTFTQGLAQGLGVTTQVTSPTFTLVAEYDARDGMRLIHMDSYRLGDRPADAVLEADTFGFEELLDDPDAVVVIEWAERLAALLPQGALHVTFLHRDEAVDTAVDTAADTVGHGGDQRTIHFAASAAPGLDIIAALEALERS